MTNYSFYNLFLTLLFAYFLTVYLIKLIDLKERYTLGVAIITADIILFILTPITVFPLFVLDIFSKFLNLNKIIFNKKYNTPPTDDDTQK